MKTCVRHALASGFSCFVLLAAQAFAAPVGDIPVSVTVPGQVGPTMVNLIYGGALSTPVYTFHLPYGTSLASLRAYFSLAPGAVASPASGVARNFTRPRVPVVVTQNGRARTSYARAVVMAPRSATRGASYDIGSPVLRDIWVDPVGGSDSAGDGTARARAYRTIARAWRDVPANVRFSSAGYRLMLCPGSYRSDEAYLEHRYGTYDRPLVLQAADGRNTAFIRDDLQFFSCNFVYLRNLVFEPANGGDGLHLDSCEYVVIQNCAIRGGPGTQRLGQEALKANQCEYLYVEDSEIANAYGNALDYMCCHYGHIRRCQIHDADDWAAYVKGGSSDFLIESNRIWNGDAGGFVAGQGAGSEYLTAPWLFHEASNIRFVRNIVRDCFGAGFGVNGGYNILFASNTLYRVGARSHGLEVSFGLRSLDNASEAPIVDTYALWGGWVQTRLVGEQRIPNRNVYIYNNILYNPMPHRSAWQHFEFTGPWRGNTNPRIPFPAATDDNLRIRGNILWNGPPDLELGIGDGTACQPSNPSCNATLLRARNHINQFAPQLVNPAGGDFRPVPGGNVARATFYPVPAFTGAYWDEYEPDGFRAAARTLANGRTQRRSIHAAGDTDWAKFRVGRAGARNVRIETAGAAGDTQLWLYRANGSRLAYNDNGGAGNFSRITRSSLPRGTYYVKIREYGNNGKIPAYTLRTVWSAP